MGTLRKWLAREGKGADQRLALAVGCHVSHISRIANFKKDASPSLARKIIAATGSYVDFNALYTLPKKKRR